MKSDWMFGNHHDEMDEGVVLEEDRCMLATNNLLMLHQMLNNKKYAPGVNQERQICVFK